MLCLSKIFLSLVICYLVGSIPTAYIFGYILKRIDIRQYGSGNVGATNAFRVLGKGPGFFVLFLDVLKGVIATTFIPNMLGLTHTILLVILGLIVVAGHNWTIFLDFKGGKGIATSLGVLIGLTIKISVIRPVLFLSLLIWAGIFLLTGFVSLASIIAATLLPVLMCAFNQPFEVIILGVIFCVFIILRHRTNIHRLLEGSESRVNFPFKLRK